MSWPFKKTEKIVKGRAKLFWRWMQSVHGIFIGCACGNLPTVYIPGLHFLAMM
jgi:hypothetical protein